MNKILISAMALVALATTVSADIKPFVDLKAASSSIAGILYSMTDNVEFELGLSYSALNAEPTTPVTIGTYENSRVVFVGAQASLNVEDIVKSHVGVNYKF